MHPEDANARGLLSGTVVEVRSRVGAVQVPLELSDEVMRGVVSLPHGFGHSRPGTRMRVAEAHAGVSLNDLTDDQEVDELSGNAAFSGIPVSVSLLASVTRPLDEKAVAHA
jgi:anaerobic selenocysteine-containing dehydrogenase